MIQACNAVQELLASPSPPHARLLDALSVTSLTIIQNVGNFPLSRPLFPTTSHYDIFDCYTALLTPQVLQGCPEIWEHILR